MRRRQEHLGSLFCGKEQLRRAEDYFSKALQLKGSKDFHLHSEELREADLADSKLKSMEIDKKQTVSEANSLRSC